MRNRFALLTTLLLATLVTLHAADSNNVSFSAVPSPVVFRGDATTAYRDPTAIYHDGWFRLFFTLVKIEPDKRPFSYCAWSKSRDLVHWSEPTIFTTRDQSLNYGSPGNIIRQGDEWVLCLQTYPRPNGEKFGNDTARIWTMRSNDLESWGEPELIRVKGPKVPQEKMGRMIDPFLIEDKDEPGKWWCFYKVGMAWSRDLKVWTHAGHSPMGENPCVIVDGNEYVMFLSGGIIVKRSSDLKTWRDEGELTLGRKEWPWAQGRLTAAFVLDLRKQPGVNKALMFFHGSDYPENDRRGGFDNFASIGMAWSDDLKHWCWPQGQSAEAKVAPYKGRNVIFVDGQPLAPLMYSGTEHSRETWAGQPRKSIEDFTALGYEIIQTDMWLKYSLRPDGTFDMDGIRKQLAGILDVNPSAKIVVRINVSAPRWWLEQNPDERCKVTAGNEAKDVFGGNTAESLASEKYAVFARQSLVRFLEELAKTPEGDRVIGFHIGGGVYGEWHYYGIYNEPDASEPMRQTFIAFAKTRYGTLGQINAAWRTTFASFDELVVPTFARRCEVSDGDFRDPQRDRYVIDYYECQQATVSALVNGLAKLTKETWPRPAIVGLFYGYFYGGWTVGAQASQFDIKTLFRSPYVDYFSGPYASRNMYGSGVFRTLADSVTLNGKVWISEHDGGTHVGHVGDVKFPDLPRDEAESLARMRRNFMFCLSEGAGQWWYDFGPKNKSGWWSTPALLAEAKSLLRMANAALEQPYEKPSDVLVVYDMTAFNYVRPAKQDKLTSKTTEAMTDSLLGTGAAFDRIFLMDLQKVDLSRYKLVIFGNTFVLDDEQRRFIKERVIREGRSVVFMSGAGYTDGRKNDCALISDLVGLRIEKATNTETSVSATLSGQRYELDANGLSSFFTISDPAAHVIGSYASGATAAAVTTAGGSKVYYFGVPLKASLEFFKALLGEARVRTYVGNTVERDYVTVGGGLIGIYSVGGGEKTVKPLNGHNRTITTQPYSTQYFDIRDGGDK